MKYETQFSVKIENHAIGKVDSLLLPITCDSSSDSSKCATNAVLQSLAVIRKLTLSFCSLAQGVLLLAFLLQPFSAKEAADSFFGRAYGLVVAALSTAWVVGRDAARGGDCVGANLADGVRGIFLDCCFVLGSIAFGLHKCKLCGVAVRAVRPMTRRWRKDGDSAFDRTAGRM